MLLIKLSIKVSLLVLCLLITFVPSVSAITQGELNSIINHTSFYDSNDTFCSSTSYGTLAVNSLTGSPWNSGLKAPYILEQFAIETLKDLAKKTGTTETDVVTQEHVLALIAFMFGEGGDIKNDNLFNPLNSGINIPGLVSGAISGVGNQSFISFDAGVEATASTIVGSYQNRLPAILVKPKSTAEEFMYALTYYDKYDGNHEWAAASSPPNQDNYYKDHIEIVEQIRNNYKNIAGLVIGTPALEQLDSITNFALLKYSPTPIQGQTTGCSKNNIVSTALSLAWPNFINKTRGITKSDAATAYQTAMPLYNNSKGDDEWTDCGVFVSTVLRDSGADTNYPLIGTSIQQNYIENHPEIYQIINVENTSSLQPGDIFVNSQHTFIYVGSQSGGYNTMAGSLHDWVPQANNAYFASGNGEQFSIARLR